MSSNVTFHTEIMYIFPIDEHFDQCIWPTSFLCVWS